MQVYSFQNIGEDVNYVFENKIPSYIIDRFKNDKRVETLIEYENGDLVAWHNWAKRKSNTELSIKVKRYIGKVSSIFKDCVRD